MDMIYISSEQYIRRVLNKGFLSFLQGAFFVDIAIIVACYFLGYVQDAMFAAATIPFILISWLLAKRENIYGVVILVILATIGAAWSVNPNMTYVGPGVSIYLIIAPLIATRFIDPQAGIWTLFMQLFVLMFGLILKETPAQIAVRYAVFAFLNLTLIVGAFTISSNILRNALVRAYEDEQELQRMYDDVLSGWSHALELRNKETRGHTDRVTRLTLQMAAALNIEDERLADMRRGALLHDIGKTGIPDSILLKPGPLSAIERDIMMLHPTYAYQWLKPFRRLGTALDIPYCHHERWNGSGYPRGLRGKDIPLAARIFTIVDVFDALTSTRPYREAMSRDVALNYIKQRAGKDFDPELVELFLREEEKLFNQTNDDIT